MNTNKKADKKDHPSDTDKAIAGAGAKLPVKKHKGKDTPISTGSANAFEATEDVKE